MNKFMDCTSQRLVLSMEPQVLTTQLVANRIASWLDFKPYKMTDIETLIDGLCEWQRQVLEYELAVK